MAMDSRIEPGVPFDTSRFGKNGPKACRMMGFVQVVHDGGQPPGVVSGRGWCMSVLNLLLQQLDLVRGEIEEPIDAGVQVGFGGGEGGGEAGLVVALFGEVGFPFVGDARALHGVGLELEALLQGLAQRIEGKFPPGGGLLVQGIGAGFAEGLAQAALDFDLRLVALLGKSTAGPGEIGDGFALGVRGVGDWDVLHGLGEKSILPTITAQPQRLRGFADEEPSGP